MQIAPYVGLGESEATVGDVFSSGGYHSWDTLFLTVADAVGRRTEGERVVAEFDADLLIVPVGGGIPPEVFAEIEQTPTVAGDSGRAGRPSRAGRRRAVARTRLPVAGALLTDLERLFVDA